MTLDRVNACFISENPPWADRAIQKNRVRIIRAFGLEALPKIIDGRKYTELGCGHYGCVYKTSFDDKVLKITSDPTEISLITFILSSQDIDDTDGIVRYYGLLDLRTTYRSRPMFAVLREIAYNIGFLRDTSADWRRKIIKAHLERYLSFGRIVRDSYKKHGDKPGFDEDVALAVERYADGDKLSLPVPSWVRSAERAGYGLAGCKAEIEELSQTPEIYPVGETLGWFLCHGKLLADVHLQNIGQVVRPENAREPIAAITDPGHAVDVVPVYSYICT